MRLLTGIIASIALVLLLAEADTITSLLISKGIAIILLIICGKLLPKVMTREEWNEEI